MKRIKVCVAGAVAGMALGAAAEEAMVSKQEFDALQKEVSVLKTQLAEQPEKLLKPVKLSLPEGLEFGALVEVEAGYSSTKSEDASDISLATVELAAGWQLIDWLRADLVFLYEEDDTDPMEVDQAILTIGNTENFPMFLQVGKMYVPFGNLDSFFISDPVALELAEARETAALLGLRRADSAPAHRLLTAMWKPKAKIRLKTWCWRHRTELKMKVRRSVSARHGYGISWMQTA